MRAAILSSNTAPLLSLTGRAGDDGTSPAGERGTALHALPGSAERDEPRALRNTLDEFVPQPIGASFRRVRRDPVRVHPEQFHPVESLAAALRGGGDEKNSPDHDTPPTAGAKEARLIERRYISGATADSDRIDPSPERGLARDGRDQPSKRGMGTQQIQAHSVEPLAAFKRERARQDRRAASIISCHSPFPPPSAQRKVRI